MMIGASNVVGRADIRGVISLYSVVSE